MKTEVFILWSFIFIENLAILSTWLAVLMRRTNKKKTGLIFYVFLSIFFIKRCLNSFEVFFISTNAFVQSFILLSKRVSMRLSFLSSRYQCQENACSLVLFSHVGNKISHGKVGRVNQGAEK